MKKDILTFVLGFILASVICVGASVIYSAKDIKFSPSDDSWNVTNVEDALNDVMDMEADTIKFNHVDYLIKDGIHQVDYVANSFNSSYSVPIVNESKNGFIVSNGVGGVKFNYQLTSDKYYIVVELNSFDSTDVHNFLGYSTVFNGYIQNNINNINETYDCFKIGKYMYMYNARMDNIYATYPYPLIYNNAGNINVKNMYVVYE